MDDHQVLDDATDSADFFEKNPIEAFTLYAEAKNWLNTVEDRSGEETDCHFMAADSFIKLATSVQCLPEEELFMIAMAHELNCPPEHLLYLCLKLNEVNEKIIIGTLVYQVEFSLLVWKTGVTLANVGGITADQVEELVTSGLSAFKSHIRDICDVVGVPFEIHELQLEAAEHAGRMN